MFSFDLVSAFPDAHQFQILNLNHAPILGWITGEAVHLSETHLWIAQWVFTVISRSQWCWGFLAQSMCRHNWWRWTKGTWACILWLEAHEVTTMVICFCSIQTIALLTVCKQTMHQIVLCGSEGQFKDKEELQTDNDLNRIESMYQSGVELLQFFDFNRTTAW